MFFKRRRERRHWDGIAHQHYTRLVEQARLPYFYTEMNVADSLEGRFDLLALHVGFLVRRLGKCDMTQALVDLMFADMDVNLREVGVADLAVGRKVRKLAEAFYGRLHAYGDALDANDATALEQALCRNLYRRDDEPKAAAMAAYAIALAAQLVDNPTESLLQGTLELSRP